MILASVGCSKNTEQLAKIKELEQDRETLQSESDNLRSRIKDLEKSNSELKTKTAMAEQETKNAKNLAATAQRELERMSKAKEAELERARSEAPAKKLAAVKSGFEQQLAAIVSIEGDVSKGRGVVVKADGKTWLYSSPQVFSGNSKLSIKGAAGTAVTKFGEFQIAADSPVCRLEILQDMPASFEIAPDATVEASASFMTTTPASEGGPLQAIESLSTDVADHEFGIDASGTEQSIGCPVVAMDSGKIVGILALAPPAATLWPDAALPAPALPRAQRINRTIDWKKSTIAAFMAEQRKIDEINNTSRLLHALALIRGTSSGLTLDAQVAGTSTSVNQILGQNSALPLVAELKKLQTDLSGTGLKMSDRDIARRLGGSFQQAIAIGRRQLQDLKITTVSPYNKPLAEESLKWRAEADEAITASIQGLAK
jgi:hypothetical protein